MATARACVLLVLSLFVLTMSAQTGMTAKGTGDADEVMLACEMIRQDDIDAAEKLLQAHGWKLKFRNYETVYYTRVGDGKACAFRVKSVAVDDSRLRTVSFTTATAPREMVVSMNRNGFRMTRFEDDIAYFKQIGGDITASLDVDLNLLGSSVVFYIRGPRSLLE